MFSNQLGPPSFMPSSLEDKIWFTYKARIQAQIRLERLDRHSQLLLVWYAFLGAVVSIVVIRYPTVLGENTDIFAAILATALLSVSLAVTSRDFRGRSMEMRRNYLELQHLYDEIVSRACGESQQLARYHALLSAAENHKGIDDKIFRVKHSDDLTTRKPTWREYTIVYGYFIFCNFILFILYSAPIIALLRGLKSS